MRTRSLVAGAGAAAAAEAVVACVVGGACWIGRHVESIGSRGAGSWQLRTYLDEGQEGERQEEQAVAGGHGDFWLVVRWWCCC